MDIDYFNRFLSQEKYWKIAPKPYIKKDIGEIIQQLNSHIQSESLARRSVQICPVEALKLIRDHKKNLMISEKRCLGDTCLECLKLIPSQSTKSE